MIFDGGLVIAGLFTKKIIFLMDKKEKQL